MEPNLPFFVKYINPNDTGLFSNFIDIWAKQNKFSWSLVFDCEFISNQDKTNDDDYTFLPKICKIIGICTCWDKTCVYFIPFTDVGINDRGWKTVKCFMTKSTAIKILFDMKAQLKLFLYHKVKVQGPFQDPKIAAWIIHSDENKDHTLYYLMSHYLNQKGFKYNLIQSFEAQFNKPKLEPNLLVSKFALRTYCSFQIMEKLQSILMASDRQYTLFKYLEMRLLPLLSQMEYRGIGFNDSKCQNDREAVEKKLLYLQEKAYQVTGLKFDLASPDEISFVLFDHLQLPIVDYEENEAKKRKHPTTSADVLEKLINLHPFPSILLEHRKLTHLLTHYMDILSKFAHFDLFQNMHRIYSTIQQTVVPTGRLAFTNPNLQAITHPVTFESVSKEKLTVSIRDSFVPEEGYLLLSADYSQLEVRILAHFSEDQDLVKLLNNNGDIFCQIASECFAINPEKVSPQEREHAKHICYGILYGMGAKTLASEMRVSSSLASQYIQKFKTRYKGIQLFFDKIIQDCSKYGYVTTLLGRRRYLNGINSLVSYEKSKAERQVYLFFLTI